MLPDFEPRLDTAPARSAAPPARPPRRWKATLGGFAAGVVLALGGVAGVAALWPADGLSAAPSATTPPPATVPTAYPLTYTVDFDASRQASVIYDTPTVGEAQSQGIAPDWTYTTDHASEQDAAGAELSVVLHGSGTVTCAIVGPDGTVLDVDTETRGEADYSTEAVCTVPF